jgi:hypothetical protein
MSRSWLCAPRHPDTTDLPDISEHLLLRRLLALRLETSDFVIFGSAPLLVHGLRTNVSDIDVVARGAAWERARAIGILTTGPLSGAPMAHFWGGLIEVSPRWTSRQWNVDDLIEHADIVQGVRFANLHNVLTHKRMLNRAKDMADIAMIERHLAGPAPATSLRVLPPAPFEGVAWRGTNSDLRRPLTDKHHSQAHPYSGLRPVMPRPGGSLAPSAGRPVRTSHGARRGTRPPGSE